MAGLRATGPEIAQLQADCNARRAGWVVSEVDIGIKGGSVQNTGYIRISRGGVVHEIDWDLRDSVGNVTGPRTVADLRAALAALPL